MYNSLLLILFFLISSSFQLSSQKNSRSEEFLDSLKHIDGNPPMGELITLLEKLKTISLAENNKNTLAFSLNGLSQMYYDTKNYYLYESTLDKYMEVAIDTTELGLMHYSTALSHYALLAQTKGDHKNAIELNLSAIELKHDSLPNLYQLAVIYGNISNNYRLLGDYDNSLQAVYKSKEYYSKLFFQEPDLYRLAYCKSYFLVGHSLIQLKEWNNALTNLNKGLDEIKNYSEKQKAKYLKLVIDIHLRRAQANLGLLDFDNAFKDLTKVKSLQSEIKYRTNLMYELFGEYYFLRSEFIKSIEFYDMALEYAKIKYSNNRNFPVLSRIYYQKAKNFIQLDSINQAFNNFQKGLRYFDENLKEKWSNNPSIQHTSSLVMGLELLTAKANYSQNKFTETLDTFYLNIAKTTYNSAMNLVDDMRLSYINEGSKYYIVSQAQSLYRDYIELLVSAEKYFPEEEWSEEIYNTIQRNKNSILIERIKEKVAVLSSDLPSPIKEKESKLRSNISLYTKLLLEVDEADTTTWSQMKSHKDALFRAKEEFAFFNNNLKSEYPEYYSLTNTTKQYYTITDVKNSLSSEQAVIEYFATDSGFISIVMNNTDVKVNLLENENISKLLTDYIAAISQSPKASDVPIVDLKSWSTQLHDVLLEGITELENVNQLYIIPDGDISKLAFSSLINPETKKYLLSDKSISYLASIDQLLNQNKSISQSNLILGISPNFSDNKSNIECNGSNLAELTYAKDELTYLQTLYKGTYIKEGDATLQTFIDNAKDYSVIHLATHACLNSTDPMLSEIFFSDRSITNFELQNLNINPDLVVLAACNTAQGEIQKGEGVISLSRGFFEAGVKSLVSSLSPINDYSSSEIIKKMYAHLKYGKSKSQSLRLAKLEYLETADNLRSHPYYWAGLIQIGDSSPIIEKSSWIPPIIIGLLILFGIFFLSKRKSL